MRLILPAVLFTFAALLPACGDDDPAPDLIFHNGVILTMDEGTGEASAVAVTGGTIASVGREGEILALRGSETEVVDLGGRTLLPGFVDPHTHILNDASSLGMSLSEAQDLAFQHGITAIGDLYVDQEFLGRMQRLQEAGDLRLRASLYLAAMTPCGEDRGGWYKAHKPSVDPEDTLRVVGVKLFADGGSCELPAYSQPAPDTGNLWLTQDQMNLVVADAQSAGFQVAIHAIGDRALEQAQVAIEAALEGGPNEPRHRIEHNSTIRPDLLSRYADVDIIPIIWSASRACAAFYLGEAFVGPERASWLVPYRSLLETGAEHVTWHSDYPFNSTDPLLHLFNLVTGKQIAGGEGLAAIDAEGREPGEICEPPAWAKEQTITASEGLRMLTVEAAYALGQDTVLGSLAPGKLADLVVLTRNPLTADPDTIQDIEVQMTMVGGLVEYCAPGESSICPADRD